MLIQYPGATTRRDPSPAIWDNIAMQVQALEQPGYRGIDLFDDFNGYPSLPTVASDTYPFNFATENSGTFAPKASVEGGVMTLTTGAADNNAVNVQVPGTGEIYLDRGRPLAFEARIALGNVAGTGVSPRGNHFVGLSLANRFGVDEIFEDTIAVDAAVSAIGFWRPEGDGDGIDLVAVLAGQTLQTLVADIPYATAAEWVKLGFVLDPYAAAHKRMRVYKNGELYTTVAASVVDAATFPHGAYLSRTLAAKNGSANAEALDIDWWRVAQTRVS